MGEFRLRGARFVGELQLPAAALVQSGDMGCVRGGDGTRSGRAHVCRAYARVGIMGNPTTVQRKDDQARASPVAAARGCESCTRSCDGARAAASMTVENFWAEVSIAESQQLVIQPHPLNDPTVFGSLADLHGISRKEGYQGGLRLMQAGRGDGKGAARGGHGAPVRAGAPLARAPRRRRKRFYEYCTERALPTRSATHAQVRHEHPPVRTVAAHARLRARSIVPPHLHPASRWDSRAARRSSAALRCLMAF